MRYQFHLKAQCHTKCFEDITEFMTESPGAISVFLDNSTGHSVNDDFIIFFLLSSKEEGSDHLVANLLDLAGLYLHDLEEFHQLVEVFLPRTINVKSCFCHGVELLQTLTHLLPLFIFVRLLPLFELLL